MNPPLRIGVLGCGPIAQFAHFEACQKASNVVLYAICDAAPDLLNRMQSLWQAQFAFNDYEQMLADPALEAVIIATADHFHVPLALRAVKAGKHVLVEKPLSYSIAECQQLIEAAAKHNVVVQVAHMKRFDAGIEYAQSFVQDRLGELIALKAWYGDNTQRYTETNNLQPLPFVSPQARKPPFDPKANLEHYYMMAHGSHLIDTAIFLAGPIGSIEAKLRRVQDAWCWFVAVEFQNGTLGHLDLTIKIRGRWHEGFQVYGEHGTVSAQTFNPWYYKSSEVECYLEAEQQSYKPLAADGFSYRRQLEHFASVIKGQAPQKGTSLEEGLAITKAMIAIERSAKQQKRIYLEDKIQP